MYIFLFRNASGGSNLASLLYKHKYCIWDKTPKPQMQVLELLGHL